MLEKKLPWPFGGVNIAPFVSTAQTNVSAGDLVAAFGKQNVQVELDTLKTFAGKVEALLAAMEGSPAAPYKLQEQKLTGKSFASAEFAEATALTTAYEKVHAQLVQLHKDFAAQIQKMQAAVSQTASIYATNEDHTTAAQNAVAKDAGVPTSAPGANGSTY
ncbi:hypothetical protein [Streptomyces sp. CBMA156]|uniref:hypothetical protein n=1 Tax=Streptomyces sp. CBMA156 TaxID=1930280 RepID=UPI001661E069|nr:hypothetical protein [Streptomyces sp. CBMA156]MBD0669162.1 hypothetical protein [Streptomyces sp. CBMA156]